MPLLTADFIARGIFRNAHVNTIYPALFRQVDGVRYRRERLSTPDGDFLDLDWSEVGGDRLVIALHGLEGNSGRHYIKGIIRAFNGKGWDGIGFNFRSCSGEPNRALRSYHMGETGDLAHVLNHVLEQDRYRSISLVGFSLGGNVVLKYLGDQGAEAGKVISAAVAFSVPCHVPSASIEIGKWYNRQYVYRFLSTLNEKMKEKAGRFEELTLPPAMPRTFEGFDDQFTAPIHGFRDAAHYWESCSSVHLLPRISVPTLMVNALDDTFLSRACYPDELAARMRNFYLEMPRWGGHVGFVERRNNLEILWSERRALAFVNEQAKDSKV